MIPATLSLDLDDVWTYLKVRGDASWRERPTHLPLVIPAVLDILASAGATATIFVVGADAAHREHSALLRQLDAAGHEIGNHSLEHLSWQRALPASVVADDVRASHDAITQLFGRAPRGYRAPGFSWNRSLLETLVTLNYRYDASVFPTWLGPVARMAYRARGTTSPEHRVRLDGLFGDVRDVQVPLRPFGWSLARDTRLTELPVTTVPFIRTPLHHTYIAYLASFSEAIAMAYVTSAVQLCRMTRTPISYLLHPTDLIGADAVPALQFFPGMSLSTTRKQRLLKRVLQRLSFDGPLVSLGSAIDTIDAQALAYHVPQGSRDR